MKRRKIPFRLGAAIGGAIMLAAVLADPQTVAADPFGLIGEVGVGALIGACLAPIALLFSRPTAGAEGPES